MPTTRQPRGPLFIWLLGALAILVTLAGVVYATYGRPGQVSDRRSAASVSPLPAFSLTDSNGQRFDSTSLRGRVVLLFFGFTRCPDVCPTTLSSMTRLVEALGTDAAHVAPVFISVDPERDTPEELKVYGTIFDPRIVMLTGTRAEIDKVVADYSVYARRVTTTGDDYTMDHTAAVFLLDRRGVLRGLIDFHDDEAALVAKVRGLLQEEGG